MIDPLWICNFTYVFTNGIGGSLDSAFKKTEVVKQGTDPSVQLDTTDITKAMRIIEGTAKNMGLSIES